MTINDAISEFRHYITHDAYCEAPSNEACEMALEALRAQQEQPNEPLEKVAQAIIKIVENGGCPPDKNCARDQNCNQCYIEWLKQMLPSFQQEQPNEPLTVEELREMDGEPVWVEFVGRPDGSPIPPLWMIVDVGGKQFVTDVEYVDWGDEGWFAYRRKPEQED